MAKQQKFHHVDRPEISETFVDSMKDIVFANGLLRIELCVTRMNEPQPPAPPIGKRFTACRLVMTGELVDELMNRLMQINQVLQQARAKEQPKGPVN